MSTQEGGQKQNRDSDGWINPSVITAAVLRFLAAVTAEILFKIWPWRH